MKFYSAPAFSPRHRYGAMSLLCLLISGGMSAAHAGGVTLNGTRFIYPQGANEVTVNTTNGDKKTAYLVQSWVADDKGNKTTNFIVTPPLFVLKSGAVNVLRIMYAGPALPEDKETLFYFNNKTIPSVDKKSLNGNTLQIATQSIIKLFYRPTHLPVKSVDIPGMLRCQQSGNAVTVSNPTPYYATLVNFSVGGRKLPNTMVSPKGSQTVSVLGVSGGPVTYQTLNDYGAMTPRLTCKA